LVGLQEKSRPTRITERGQARRPTIQQFCLIFQHSEVLPNSPSSRPNSILAIRSINLALWLRNCPCRSMKQTTLLLGFLTLLLPASALAGGLTRARPISGEALAFARYIASIHERDPFTESGPVAVVIEASLPGQHSRLMAIRQTSDSESIAYQVLQSDGDPAVTEALIAPYLKAQEQVQDLPLSSVLITPANYQFRYLGEVATEGAPAYAFRIVPKKKHDGLIRGELWIDSITGVAVLQAGRLVKTSSPVIRRIELVRDTKLVQGHACARITRVAIETRRSGRGYLTMTEYSPAPGDGGDAAGAGAPGVQAGAVVGQ